MAQEMKVQVPKIVAPEMDKAQLLILGLNLLNKGLNLPCAVVQPQAKPTSSLPTKSSSAVPISPCKTGPVLPVPLSAEGSRKRKRDQGADSSEVDKKEKRKMMNRVSAQNARDRKKVYVEDLEKQIALLEEKNKKLEEENSTLRQQTTSLEKDNEQLAERLDYQADDLKALVKETLIQEPFWLGSAVPHLVSQQQKRFLKQLFLVRVLLSFSLYWPTSSNLPALPLQMPEQEEVKPSLPPSDLSPLLRESPWWGANHSEWNPQMN